MSADFTPEKEDYKILTPFKMQVLTNFPYIEADFDALTNYQLLCKIVEYLNGVIHNENEITEQMNSLYNAYVNLQNYVNTYFDNLDLQEEVNNKIDQMIEDGYFDTLVNQLISQMYYLKYFKTETNSWQDALDIIQNETFSKATIYLPKDVNIDENLTITKANITLKDGCFENAGLILNYSTSNSDKDNCNIENITFIGNNSFGIKIINAYYPTISNCVFKNTNENDSTYGILLVSNDDVFQNSRRVIITNNQFKNCDYGIYTDNPNEVFGASGDVIISNNQIDTKICNIYSVGVDGHIISNNVLYMPGYELRDMTKTNNIFIKKSNFIEITNNSCFEAGQNGIHLEHCTDFIIANNNIDWCGQNTPASAIYLEIDENDGEFIGNINNNLITYATKYGMEINANENGLLNVRGNNITATGDKRHYYGLIDLATITHYTIYAPNTKGCVYNGNLSYPTYRENIGSMNYIDNINVNNQKSVTHFNSTILNRDITVTDYTAIDLQYKYNIININAAGTFDLTKITGIKANTPITIIQYNNSSVTWATSSSIIYSSNAVMTTSRWATKQFIYTGQQYVELNESNVS